MLLQSVADIQPGTRLARPVLGEDGSVLLAPGVVLTHKHLELLRARTVSHVYVADDGAARAQVPEVLRAEVRAQAQQTVHKVFAGWDQQGNVEVGRVLAVVESVLADILNSPEAIMALMDARSVQNELIEHSVGVMVLSLLLGTQMGLNAAQLQELGVGALLHDVGKLLVPEEIWKKPGKLTPGERQVMESHAEHGFQILRKITGFPLLAAHMAYQHHERLDGTGYPRRLRGHDIHLYGAICAVADVYDALTAPRPYRPGFPPAAALGMVREGDGRQYHAQVVRALMRVVAPYPVATLLELNSGEVAVVENMSATALDRPIVRIVRDSAGHLMQGTRRVDLSMHPEYRIERTVSSVETRPS